MRLATSTCLFPSKRLGGRTPIIDSMRMCKECGFEVIDLNFTGGLNPASSCEICGDDWESKIDAIGEEAAKLGLSFSQSHAPYDSNLWRADRIVPEEVFNWYFESVRRSALASAKLGVKWMVVHAQTDILDDEQSYEQNIKRNIEFYSPIVEWVKKYGTGVAVENMAEFNPDKTRHRFTATVDEQIGIIDSFNDPAVGGCWDFGHAEMVYRDQVPALRKLGHRLRATHVQESTGKADDHFLPFVKGQTHWEELMACLKEINYQGDFTYEAHGFMSKIPNELRIQAGKFAYEVGLYLLSLYEKA